MLAIPCLPCFSAVCSVNLREFAGVLISHGFVNAINLDGGGSATTVVNDVVASYPSDHW